MNKQHQIYRINLDALSRDQLEYAKQKVNEVTGARFSYSELVRCGIDLMSRELERQLNNSTGLANRLINRFGKYRWARSATQRKRK